MKVAESKSENFSSQEKNVSLYVVVDVDVN